MVMACVLTWTDKSDFHELFLFTWTDGIDGCGMDVVGVILRGNKIKSNKFSYPNGLDWLNYTFKSRQIGIIADSASENF